MAPNRQSQTTWALYHNFLEVYRFIFFHYELFRIIFSP